MSCIEISYLGFNTTFVTVLLDAAQELQWDLAEFQYNFCYCSILQSVIFLLSQVQVSIQLLLLFYIMETAKEVFAVDVSIQLLLLFYLRLRKCRSVHMGFNTTFVTVLLVVVSSALLKAAFQYNFCYCSMHNCYLFYYILLCFNTTFVTVLW